MKALDLPAEGGLLVQRVEAGTAAEEAGIRGPRQVVIVGNIQPGVGGDLIVAVDGNVACAAATDDQTYCWGNGYLGNGSTGYAVTPTVVSGGLSFTSLAAGDAYHCGTVVGGAAYCWGGGRNGRLGNGTMTEALVPTAVSGGHAFSQLSSSQDHTCGVATDGNAFCWGGNDMGELGNRTTTPSTTPVRVKLFAP